MLLFLSVSLFTFLMYMHLTMHFIVLDNVARCLSLVFNVIFTYIFLGRTTSLLTCSTLLVVMVGFVSGVQGEIGRPIHTYTCVHYFCLSLYSLCIPNFNMKNSSVPSYLSDDDILYVCMYVCAVRVFAARNFCWSARLVIRLSELDLHHQGAAIGGQRQVAHALLQQS